MAYHVELTARANRDLKWIYERIHAEDSIQAFEWFNGLEATILSLEKHPARGAVTPENKNLRQLLYVGKPHTYRVIYRIHERARKVKVIHIRHGRMNEFLRRKR